MPGISRSDVVYGINIQAPELANVGTVRCIGYFPIPAVDFHYTGSIVDAFYVFHFSVVGINTLSRNLHRNCNVVLETEIDINFDHNVNNLVIEYTVY